MQAPRPLLWAALALFLGCTAGLQAHAYPWILAGAAGLGAMVLLARIHPRARALPVWLLLLFAAALARGFGASFDPPRGAMPGEELKRAREEPFLGRWRPRGPGPVSTRGWLEPPPGETRAGHRLLLELVAGGATEGDWLAVLPGGAVVPWPRGPVPGSLARDGTFAAASMVRPDELVRIEATESPVHPWRERIARWRRSFGDRVATLERPGASRGLLRAILAGDRSGLPAGRVDLFTRTGTRHLLALSGLHVGLFFACFLLPATSILGRRVPATLVRLALLGAYALLVGAGDPVTRASLALVLTRTAPLLRRRDATAGRRPDSLSIWAFALALECLLDPAGVRSLSLRLSYLATLGILLGTRPVRDVLASILGKDERSGLHTRAESMRRVLRARFLAPCAGAVAASVAAVLATLPIVWARFGEWSPPGVLVTPLVLPFVAALIALGWVGVLFPADWLAEILARLSAGMIHVLEMADGLPGTPLLLPERPAWFVWLTVTVVFVALRFGGCGALARLALALAGLLLLPWTAAPAGFELHALDVGHGSSLVLRAPGVPALVFDAGSRDRSPVFDEALAPLLARWDVARPWVVLTHDHEDHHSALLRLIERAPPAVFLGARPAQLVERLPHDVLMADPAPGEIMLAPGAARFGPFGLRLLRGTDRPGNEGSRSLEVTWRDDRMLLTGDAETAGWERFLHDSGHSGPFRLVLLPHHGSDSERAGALLDHLDPTEVWVSVARRPALAAELDRRRIPWGWTGRDGPLALFLP